MSSSDKRISSLLDSSRQILLDCCLENGAVVAANTDKPYYPKGANDYRYVWPRDATFILYALQILGTDKRDNFIVWLLERAEGFSEQGLVYRRYATNGAASYPLNEFQPDQSGSLLWLLTHEKRSLNAATLRAATTIADKLCDLWLGDAFKGEVYDLWEHHHGEGSSGNFTYSLASCAQGLLSATSSIKGAPLRWKTAADQMLGILDHHQGSHFDALINDEDSYVDASLLGLAWPFGLTMSSEKIRATVDRIGNLLHDDTGLFRFSSDTYDGRVKNSTDLNEGAGPWPLLSFWYAVALAETGRHAEADEYFNNFVLRLPDDKYIPEQLLSDSRVGVTPLGWSHAMFVITAHKLGYLK